MPIKKTKSLHPFDHGRLIPRNYWLNIGIGTRMNVHYCTNQLVLRLEGVKMIMLRIFKNISLCYRGALASARLSFSLGVTPGSKLSLSSSITSGSVAWINTEHRSNSSGKLIVQHCFRVDNCMFESPSRT